MAREVREETGLEVEVGALAYFQQVSTPTWDVVAHTVILYHWATPLSGTVGQDLRLTAEEEALTAETRFVHRDEELAVHMFDFNLWKRIWSDIDAGVDETVYLGHLVRD